MDYYSKQISKLIEELSSLPGIGSKSAQRLAFHILNMPEERVERLADTILDARRNIRYCKTCYTLTDAEECPICSNSGREKLPGIWQLMKRQDSMMVCIMYCMAQFPRCLESDRKISA